MEKSSFYRQFFLALSVITLFSIGSVMIFDTTSADALDHVLHSTHQPLVKQFIYGVLGLFLGVTIYRSGYQKFLSFTPGLLVFFTFLLVLTLIPGIGKEVNGSRRWLSLLNFSIQPSEFVKYIVPGYLIFVLSKQDGKLVSLKKFLLLMGQIAVPIFLILIEPNNGTAAVIAFTALVVLILTGVKSRYWAFPLFSFLVVGLLFAYHSPYVSSRINVYLHPELDLRGKGHQPYQAKIAAGSGQLFGKGPGNSLQKLSYLPEAQNDYIAAIYAEEFGFVGTLFLIMLYMVIAYLGFLIAFYCPERQGFLLAAIVTFLISFQSFMNLGVVSGILPSTGLNLPFFSQGGTSLIANCMGISLLLSISSQHKRIA